MSASWLKQQRKQTLLDLSTEAGLPQDDTLRKDDILENLDSHLQANATRLSRNSAFEGYFGTRRTPFKPRSSSAAGLTSDDGEVKSVVKGRGKRTTKVKSEIEELVDDVASPSQQLTRVSNAVASRTPGRPRRRSELPPSPADIADDVEYTASRLSTSLHDTYSQSGVPEAIDHVRDSLSSVTAVHGTILLLEALAIQREVLVWQYAFDIPALAIIGTPSIAISVPDLFKLLESSFWYPTILWLATSILIPAGFAYFYNLSTRSVRRGGYRTTVARHAVDPLMFNVVKALISYVVYEHNYTLGIFKDEVPHNVQHVVPGGKSGFLISSGIGALVALYEAAQTT